MALAQYNFVVVFPDFEFRTSIIKTCNSTILLYILCKYIKMLFSLFFTDINWKSLLLHTYLLHTYRVSQIIQWDTLNHTGWPKSMGQAVYIFQAGKITNVRFDKIVPYLIHARRLHMGHSKVLGWSNLLFLLLFFFVFKRKQTLEKKNCASKHYFFDVVVLEFKKFHSYLYNYKLHFFLQLTIIGDGILCWFLSASICFHALRF